MTQPLAVFVDFDGTITDADTFAILVRAVAGDDEWAAIDDDLLAGRITLRETLRREAALVRLSRSDALALLARRTTFDPAFGPFLERARACGAAVTIVSGGIGSIIRETLARERLTVEVIANDVDFHPGGWQMSFVDDSAFGHDKSVHVLAARAAGYRTAYCGDGISDFSAIAHADAAFVKAGSSLEAYCRERNVPYTAFSSFAEVNAALFG